MEKVQPNAILEFNPNQISEVRKSFNYYDVNKINQDIDNLEEWIAKQNHFLVRQFDREYLERYIISNKGSVERTKKRLDKLFTLRNLMPEFVRNLDIRNEFKPMFRCSKICVLPKPTKDNYRIIITTICSDDIDEVELIDYYRYCLVFAEYLLCHDYNAGYESIIDTTNMTMGMISKMNPIVIHKGMTLLEAYGFRLKCVHLISGSKFFDAILTIVKQGLTQKLRNRIKVHSSMEALHDYIPKDILPKDFGGQERSIKELSEQTFKELCSDEHIARIKFMEGVATDEACRLSSEFNEEYSGMPGSFKTLCVD